MDNQKKETSKSNSEYLSQGKKVSESSSECLSGKATKGTTNSLANLEGSASDLPKQKSKPEPKNERLRVPEECKPKLKFITDELQLRSMGAAVRWILPPNPKALVALTKELGYDKGGDTIDSLLQNGTTNLLCLSRELGYKNIAETLEWCMPTDINCLVELTQELGFEKGRETLRFLLSRPVVQQMMNFARGKDIPPPLSKAIQVPVQFHPEQFPTHTFQHLGGAPEPSSSSQLQSFITNRNSQRPALGASAGNHSVAQHYLQESIQEEPNVNQFQGIKMHEEFRLPSTVKEQQPQDKFKGSIGMRGEQQQRNQIGSNSSRLQDGKTTNQYFNNSRDLHNFSNCFKRTAKEPGNNDQRRKKLPTRFPAVLGENRAMYFPGNIAPEQGLNENTFNGAGMRLQNNENQYFHQSGSIYQGFHNVPMNPDIHHRIPAQIEFQVGDWKQYQKECETQMERTLGSHRGSSSKEEQKYAGTVSKLVTDKAPKR